MSFPIWSHYQTRIIIIFLWKKCSPVCNNLTRLAHFHSIQMLIMMLIMMVGAWPCRCGPRRLAANLSQRHLLGPSFAEYPITCVLINKLLLHNYIPIPHYFSYCVMAFDASHMKSLSLLVLLLYYSIILTVSPLCDVKYIRTWDCAEWWRVNRCWQKPQTRFYCSDHPSCRKS